MAYEVLETCMLVPGFNRSECASWVQAWGSILAILAAVLGVHLAHRLQLKQRAREEIEHRIRGVEILFQLLGGVKAATAKLHELAMLGNVSPYDRSMAIAELAVLEDALLRIDMAALDEFILIESWSMGTATVKQLSTLVQRIGAAGSINVDTEGVLRLFSEEYVSRVQKKMDLVDSAISGLRERLKR